MADYQTEIIDTMTTMLRRIRRITSTSDCDCSGNQVTTIFILFDIFMLVINADDFFINSKSILFWEREREHVPTWGQQDHFVKHWRGKLLKGFQELFSVGWRWRSVWELSLNLSINRRSHISFRLSSDISLSKINFETQFFDNLDQDLSRLKNN